jgi:hypothetical protein
VTGMDKYSTDKLPDEYAALGDPVQVMAEVLTLVEQVRVSNKKLGDAFVSGGLAGREWRGRDCELALLSDQLPDVTLDALLTRLAEFAAGTGPHWLRGGIADIERFNDEASILSETLRALRIVAQRQRMLPLRQRGSLPMQRALGDARVGTQLDRIAAALRDLEALAPYIVPPDPDAWTRPPLAPEPAPAAPVGARVASPFAPPAAPAPDTSLTPHVLRAVPARTDPFGQKQKTLGIRQRTMSLRLTAAMASVATQARAVGERLEPRKWLVVAVTAVVLAASTAFVGLLVRNGGTAFASQLTTTPARLTCAGRGATASLTLRDTGSGSLTWSTKPPSALTLSATQGTLKQDATAQLTVKAHTSRPAQGTLTFTSALGDATVAYSITCR